MQRNAKLTTLQLVRAATIAALYASLALLTQPISFGPIQCRLSEALTVLPLLYIEALPGVAIGCLVANIFGGAGWFDIVFGTLATLIAAALTYRSKKIQFAVLPPIFVNAIVVPFIILFASGESAGYWLLFFSTLGGQAVAVLALGLPLFFLAKKTLKPYTNPHFSLRRPRPADIEADSADTTHLD